MKKVLLAVGLVMLFAVNASALTLNFSNLVGAEIAFTGTGNTFTFTPEGGGFDFEITSGTDITDVDTVGLKGNIEGTFTIGAISTFGPLQTAPVTGSGTFSITDEASNVFSAIVSFIDIYSFGAQGGVNNGATLNLTGATYSGSNSDLQKFLEMVNITYQFKTPKNLSELTADGSVNNTSYSGSTTSSAVPEPGTMLLLGAGLLGVGLMRRRKQTRG